MRNRICGLSALQSIPDFSLHPGLPRSCPRRCGAPWPEGPGRADPPPAAPCGSLGESRPLPAQSCTAPARACPEKAEGPGLGPAGVPSSRRWEAVPGGRLSRAPRFRQDGAEGRWAPPPTSLPSLLFFSSPEPPQPPGALTRLNLPAPFEPQWE